MSDIRIVSVHEGDSSWEDDHPRFRVYLHGSGETTTHGWTHTFDVTGADVLQVIDWAQRQAGDRLTYAIALVGDDAGMNPEVARGLTWLVGRDGNDVSDGDPDEADTQRRMLLRRRAPVTIPAQDRMPDGVPEPYNDGTFSRDR